MKESHVDTPLAISIWIGVGSAVGGLLRFWVGYFGARWLGDEFPWGTLFVNVTGSFLIGVLSVVLASDGRFPVAPLTRQYFLVGLLGGYTTFSAFSLQTLHLVQDGDWGKAVTNVLISVSLCLAGVILGYGIGVTFYR